MQCVVTHAKVPQLQGLILQHTIPGVQASFQHTEASYTTCRHWLHTPSLPARKCSMRSLCSCWCHLCCMGFAVICQYTGDVSSDRTTDALCCMLPSAASHNSNDSCSARRERFNNRNKIQASRDLLIQHSLTALAPVPHHKAPCNTEWSPTPRLAAAPWCSTTMHHVTA